MPSFMSTPSFQAFLRDEKGLAQLAELKESIPDSTIEKGDIRDACISLKSHTPPKTLLVELPEACDPKTELDQLAGVCAKDTRVILCGTRNDYRFYCWLKEIGIAEYLLLPFTDAEFKKAIAFNPTPAAQEKEAPQQGKLTVVIGVRGGAGATSLSVNLASLLADGGQRTALLDLDVYFGTAAIALDIIPGKGLREALSNPDRVDAFFLERMMVEVAPKLSLLAAEEPIQDAVLISEPALKSLTRELRAAFSQILIDVPRTSLRQCQALFKEADKILLVSEPNIASLRDAIRIREFLSDTLKLNSVACVVSKAGLAKGRELSLADFERNLGAKIACAIPFAPEVVTASDAGEALHQRAKASPATKAIRQLAEEISGAPPVKKERMHFLPQWKKQA